MTVFQHSIDDKVAHMLEVFAGADTPELRESEQRRLAVSRRRAHVVVLVAVALLTAVAVAVAGAPALGWPGRVVDLFRGGSPVSTPSLSDHDVFALSVITSGRSGPRVTSRAEDLQRIGATEVREIAERAGRAYYTIDRTGGGRCYGVGFVGSTDRFGQIICQRSPAFPSPELPILSLAVFRAAPQPTATHGESALPLRGLPFLSRLEGFAADGVSSVGVETAEGGVVAVTPVADNVYVRTEGLPTGPIRALVAFDADGRRVFTQCLDPNGCR